MTDTLTTPALIELLPMDVAFIRRKLPNALYKTMRLAGPQLVLAGGFVRAVIAREEVKDIDLFAPTPVLAELHARRLAAAIPDSRLHTTQNAHTVYPPGGALPVQFIHRWSYATPVELLDSFDFTIARAAIWCDAPTGEDVPAKWHSLADSRFYADLAARRLVYRQPQRNEDAGGSILRLLKFYQRGYVAPLDSVSKVMARLIAPTVGEIMDAVAAGDGEGATSEDGLGRIMLRKLREVDPVIDPEHIAHGLTSAEQAEEDEEHEP